MNKINGSPKILAKLTQLRIGGRNRIEKSLGLHNRVPKIFPPIRAPKKH